MHSQIFRELLNAEMILAHDKYPNPHTRLTAHAVYDIYSNRVSDAMYHLDGADSMGPLAWKLIQVAGLCERIAVDLDLPPTLRPD